MLAIISDLRLQDTAFDWVRYCEGDVRILGCGVGGEFILRYRIERA